MNLKKLRLKRKKTQEQVADALGISRRQYIKWELGEVDVPALKRDAVIKIMQGMK